MIVRLFQIVFLTSACALSVACGQVDSPGVTKPVLDAASAQFVSGTREDTKAAQTDPKTETAMNAYDIDFTSIDDQPMPLSAYKDKVLLVVNTASRCGYISQYEGLQALWSEYEDRGLVVIGVPSGDFGDQELATEAEVKSFCKINYGVTFPLTEKTTVKGPAAHPFYALASDALGEAAQPKWNFHKVLVGRDGQPVKAFASAVKLRDRDLIQAIEAAL